MRHATTALRLACAILAFSAVIFAAQPAQACYIDCMMDCFDAWSAWDDWCDQFSGQQFQDCVDEALSWRIECEFECLRAPSCQ